QPTHGSARLSPDCTNPVNHVVRGGSWVAWQVPRTGRSARGGSWVWVQVPQPARSASRENYAKDNLRSFIGFRVARTLTPRGSAKALFWAHRGHRRKPWAVLGRPASLL